MSLPLGPDTIRVYREVASTDDYGNVIYGPAATSVSVRGHIQPASPAESWNLGQLVGTTIRFLSRTFPGGAFSKVVWDGREWDVVGEPRRHYKGHHFTTYLRSREV